MDDEVDTAVSVPVDAFDSLLVAPPLAPSPQRDPGLHDLGFEHRPRSKSRATSVLDWIAFALAFLAPPIGLLAGIATLIVGRARRGWTSTIGRAAVAIALVLTLALGAGGVIAGNLLARQSAFEAVVASSRQYCAALRTDPAALQSDTFAWPALSDTIDESITAMQGYATFWTGLEKIAPAGIRRDTESVAAAATGIVASVQTTRVLDDAGNIARMQRVVAASAIPAWVAKYCG